LGKGANVTGAAQFATCAVGASTGEEFGVQRGGGLPPALVQELNRTQDWRSALSVLTTIAMIACTAWLAVLWWPWAIVPAMFVMVSRQHSLAILAHDATHYRLFGNRLANEIVGRLCGYPIGVSMCTYRVVHRLHHNHLYTKADPDIPLMGGYPRGRWYLVKKLLTDLAGLTAHKNYAYFFGAPAVNTETNKAVNPLGDTSPRLRQQALTDRWIMVGVQVAMLGAAIATGWWLEYLLLWVLPLVTLFQVLLRVRAVLEHGAPAGYSTVQEAARTNLCPAWLAWILFPHNVNYHIEHHLYPAIPHYKLRRAHALLVESGALAGAEVRPVFSTFRRVFANRPQKTAVAA
jgi:fatty acid desaturase